MWIHGDLPTHKRNKLFSNDCEFIIHHSDLPTVIFLVPKYNFLQDVFMLPLVQRTGWASVHFLMYTRTVVTRSSCFNPRPLSQPHFQTTMTALFPDHHHNLIPRPQSQPYSQATITALFPDHHHSLIPKPQSQPHSQTTITALFLAVAVCSMVAKEM